MEHPLAEDGAHGGPGGLGTVHIGAGAHQHHSADTQGLGCAQDSAHIAGVLHIFQHDGVFQGVVCFFLGDGHSEHRAGAVLHRGGIVKKLCRGHILFYALQPGQVLRLFLPQHRAQVSPLGQGLPQQLDAVAEVFPLLPAESAICSQGAQTDDMLIFSGTDGFYTHFTTPQA